MPRVQYEVTPNAKQETLEVITQANLIIEQYQAQGYNLTLRQLEPTVLAGLVEREVDDLIESRPWEKWKVNEARTRAELQAISDSYTDVVAQFASDVKVEIEDENDEEDSDA